MGKREDIAESVARFILAHGVQAATLREMAAAAAESDRMLMYYFADKDALLETALDVLVAEFANVLDALRVERPMRKGALHAALDPVVLSDEVWPWACLRMELGGKAARGDRIADKAALQMADALHYWIAGQLATPNPDQRRRDATEIMIGLEGIMTLKAAGRIGLVEELL